MHSYSGRVIGMEPQPNGFLVTWEELERVCPRLASPRAFADVLDNCIVVHPGDVNAPPCVHAKKVRARDGEHVYEPACKFHAGE